MTSDRTGRFVLLAWLALVGSFGCASQTEIERVEAERMLSRADRLATIGIAQGLLHEADVLEGLGQRGEATRRAERVLALELTVDDPLREPLRLDAHGRLAELALADGRLDDADAAIDRGLAEVHARSYFEARLHLVRGRVLEARAVVHREAGREAEAQAALRAALEAHERSIAINEGLLGAEEVAPR